MISVRMIQRRFLDDLEKDTNEFLRGKLWAHVDLYPPAGVAILWTALITYTREDEDVPSNILRETALCPGSST